MTRSYPEFKLTVAIADFLKVAWPITMLPASHFPAGENRDARTGAKLKAMGTAPGWPDFIINLPGGRVGYIEVKADKGRLSPDQAAFRDAVVMNGARWALCRSVDEVQSTLNVWLDGSGITLRGRITS